MICSTRSTRLTPAVSSDCSYPGGKNLAGLYQWIIAKMPTHARYIEPFAGKGGILRRKPPALNSLLIDRDEAVIAWWRRLKWPAATAVRGDGILWLERHQAELDEDDLVYCDPPYLLSTRTKKRIYRYEMSLLEHRRLLRCVLALRCPVMISGYPSALYDEQLAGWPRFEHETITRGRTLRTEVLWCNFDPSATSPASALAYERLGADYRQRERVHRKIKRWVSRLLTIPADERRALILAIYDAVGIRNRQK